MPSIVREAITETRPDLQLHVSVYACEDGKMAKEVDSYSN